MKLLSIKEMAPDLNHPGFWNQERLIYLQAILDCCSNRTITKASLNRISSRIAELMAVYITFIGKSGKPVKYRLTKLEKEKCNEVIDMLQNHGWRCSFFIIHTKPYRPSILPSDVQPYKDLLAINEYRKAYWNHTLTDRFAKQKMTLIEIMSGSGVPYEKIIASISSGLFLKSPKGFIDLHIAENSARTARVPLSKKATSLCEYAKKHSLNFNDIPNTDIQRLKVAPLSCYLEGMDSIVFAQLQRYQLPTPPADPSEINPIVFRYTKEEFFEVNKTNSIPPIIQRKRMDKTRKQESNITLDDNSQHEGWNEFTYSEEVDSTLNWTHECLVTIKQVRYKLKKLLTDQVGTYRNGTLEAEDVEDIIFSATPDTIARTAERARSRASSLDLPHIEEKVSEIYFAYDSLGIKLAMYWIHDHLCIRKNTLDTCLEEIHYIFENGIIKYPAFNLSTWDEEDIEIMISDYLLKRDGYELSNETKKDIIRMFVRVLNYARKKHDIFIDIELPTIEKRSIVITNRNNIIGPSEFDRLKARNDPVAILAFYAGMRAGEIFNLSLNDIVCSESEFTIYIRKGKTPSAKRSIPLHLIAPPKVIADLFDHYETRRISHRAYVNQSKRQKASYKDISEASFICRNIKEFDSGTTARNIRQSLQELQDEVGNAANLHLLRHSFASMMFLRWYCCKNPDLIPELIDENHWCFSREGLAGLKNFFGENPHDPLPDSNTTAIIHLIKLIGHNNTDTFFQVYTHSFYNVLLKKIS